MSRLYISLIYIKDSIQADTHNMRLMLSSYFDIRPMPSMKGMGTCRKHKIAYTADNHMNSKKQDIETK